MSRQAIVLGYVAERFEALPVAAHRTVEAHCDRQAKATLHLEEEGPGWNAKGLPHWDGVEEGAR
eukprot:5363840-Prymnesium_polylepis.1